MFRTLATSLGALILAAPLAAAPIAAFGQDVPSYAQSAQEAPGDEQLRGRITNFDGGYDLTVRDERGYIDNVSLHPGTIINPTGLTLAAGMTVSILGYNAGDSFAANEIDTPYEYSSGVPYYSGHPWNYYGPDISLAFFFGSPGWWHGNDFHGDYRYYGGARYYNDVHIRNVYNYNNGGSFHGRAFVAPAEHGGYYRGTVHSESAVRAQHDLNAQPAGEARPQQQTHFAGPPIQHGYAHSQGVNVQNRSEAHPQYHSEARPQYHGEARPQSQSHGEAHPQSQSHGEAHPQSHGESHDHGGGHPH